MYIAQGVCFSYFCFLENIGDHVNLLQDDAKDEVNDEHDHNDRESDKPHYADHVTEGVNIIHIDVFDCPEDN